MVTAGIDMRNASIYIGSNLTSVFANTLVAVSRQCCCACNDRLVRRLRRDSTAAHTQAGLHDRHIPH